MKVQRPAAFAVNGKANIQHLRLSQKICSTEIDSVEFVSKLLDRRWGFQSPAAPIQQISISSARETCREQGIDRFSFFNNSRPHFGNEQLLKGKPGSSFYILRDDLLHPLVNGNKARKLDALLPLLEDYKVTDVVTCGGCQSAHTAAVAVSCAERGLKSHLLLRGEQPEILTGYNLVSTMYGNVQYIPRSRYANREEMLKTYADVVAGKDGSVLWSKDVVDGLEFPEAMDGEEMIDFASLKTSCRKVMIVNEGAGDAFALLGMFRLVQYLSQDHLLGKKRPVKFVVDAGTGTTAVGLGMAAMSLGFVHKIYQYSLSKDFVSGLQTDSILLRLPWEINAVMLADTLENYKRHEIRLIGEFTRQFIPSSFSSKVNATDGWDMIKWIDRRHPRKFGKVLEGEVEMCGKIAKETGVLVDPMYTLAAWETATELAQEEKVGIVVMIHTGGTLGMFGLAQRYKSCFTNLKDL